MVLNLWPRGCQPRFFFFAPTLKELFEDSFDFKSDSLRFMEHLCVEILQILLFVIKQKRFKIVLV